MSKLVIKDYPLVVLPSLAAKIGLNEAIILQQIHYWLDKKVNHNIINDVHWVYNTYAQWAEQLMFWSEVTVRRTIRSLEKKGLIMSGNFNKDRFSKKKWYTINYEALHQIDTSLTPRNIPKKQRTSNQIDQSIRSKRSVHPINLIGSYISNTEITTETTNSLSLSNSTKKQREHEMLNKWNEIVEGNKRKITLTDKRSDLLNKILAEFFENKISLWEEFCQKIIKSKFLRGEITNFKVQLDWILKQENLIKVIEGNYHQALENKALDMNQQEQEQAVIKEIEELNAPDIWKKTLLNLVKMRGVGIFYSWFRKNHFVKFEDGVLEIKSYTRFIASWIRDHYLEDIVIAARNASHEFKDLNLGYED
jgi:hypothetical protein